MHILRAWLSSLFFQSPSLSDHTLETSGQDDGSSCGAKEEEEEVEEEEMDEDRDGFVGDIERLRAFNVITIKLVVFKNIVKNNIEFSDVRKAICGREPGQKRSH